MPNLISRLPGEQFLTAVFRDHPLAAYGLILLAVGSLYAESVRDLLDLWQGFENDYSHGLLLVGAAVFLMVRDAGSNPLHPRIGYSGLVLLLALSTIWFASVEVQLRIGWQLGFVLMPMALFWALFGSAALKQHLIPLLLPVCAIPVWNVINQGDLQLVTAQVVGLILPFFGVPVLQDGVQLEIPSGAFTVAENCSGMRQLVVAIPLCLIYGHLYRLTLFGTALLAATGMLLAVIVNVIRIFVVVYAGHLTDMTHYFVVEDHVTLGWVLFSGFMFAFLLLANRVPLAERAHPATVTQAPSHNRTIPWLASLLLAATAGPMLEWRADARSVSARVVPQVATVEVAGWSFERNPVYTLAANEADLHMGGLYRSDSASVGMNIRTFWSQAQGREAVSGNNRLQDHDGWHANAPATVFFPDSSAVGSVQEIVFRDPSGARRLVWMWYQIGAHATGRAPLAKLLELRQAIFGVRTSMVISLDTELDGSIQAGRARLASFWEAAKEPALRHAAEESLQADTAVPGPSQ